MKSTIVKRCVLMGVATLAAGLAVSQASAAPSESEAPHIVVRYSDLNLSQPEDARTLYGRIRRAAREACRDVGLDDVWFGMKFHNCVDRAVTNAVAKISSPRVNEIHEARGQFLSRS